MIGRAMGKARHLYRKLMPVDLREQVCAVRRWWEETRDRLEKDIVRVDGYELADWLRDPALRSMHRRLWSMRGKYAGQRCVIMGNGPSLNKMELDVFAGEHVWGSNRAYLLYDRIRWRHGFYVGVDRRVIPDIADELLEWIDRLPGTRFFHPYAFREQGDLPCRPNLLWYNEVHTKERDLPDGMFSLDCPRYVYSVTTVTIAALQLAVHLGFNPIYLIGCDTSYTVPDSVQIEDDDPKKLVSTEADPNHFDPSYFGPGRKWHDPKVDRMVFHYRQAKEVCDRIGVRIYNATVGGQLEVFPRVDYRDIFRGER